MDESPLRRKRSGEKKEGTNNGAGSEYGEEKKGRKQGKHITYYPNGKIETIRNYRNDTIEGKSFIYYDNGQLEQKKSFWKGVAVDTMKHYMENGYMNFMYIFKDTFKIWILLDIDGTVLQQENQGYFEDELEKRKFLELQKSKVK